MLYVNYNIRTYVGSKSVQSANTCDYIFQKGFFCRHTVSSLTFHHYSMIVGALIIMTDYANGWLFVT